MKYFFIISIILLLYFPVYSEPEKYNYEESIKKLETYISRDRYYELFLDLNYLDKEIEGLIDNKSIMRGYAHITENAYKNDKIRELLNKVCAFYITRGFYERAEKILNQLRITNKTWNKDTIEEKNFNELKTKQKEKEYELLLLKKTLRTKFGKTARITNFIKINKKLTVLCFIIGTGDPIDVRGSNYTPYIAVLSKNKNAYKIIDKISLPGVGDSKCSWPLHTFNENIIRYPIYDINSDSILEIFNTTCGTGAAGGEILNILTFDGKKIKYLELNYDGNIDKATFQTYSSAGTYSGYFFQDINNDSLVDIYKLSGGSKKIDADVYIWKEKKYQFLKKNLEFKFDE